MNPAERAHAARELVARAREIHAAERPAWLRSRCAADPELALEVERLMKGAEGAAWDGATTRGTMGSDDGRETAATAENVHKTAFGGLSVDGGKVSGRFGNYEVVGLIGRGGMGMVVRARQIRPQRDVALKLMFDLSGSESFRSRFLREVEFLGRLEHPGIARIYDAGIHGATPYFAMELIEGETLLRYVARRNPSTEARLRLFAEVCDAVHYAHTKSLIHRDLKPGNILVFDPPGGGPPRAKVLDFGVARATDADLQTATMLTEVGQLVGTVPYMSPEQTSGDPAALDTRSDVYSLGVVLYELLTGKLPYAIDDKPLGEMVRVIQQEDATRLSTAGQRFRGDLETIVGKALEKDKERRYQSAAALGDDIRRFLKSEPIAARPASTAYLIRKFTRRNKVLVGGVAATFVALVAGLTATLFALDAAVRARKDAETRADERDRVARFQSEMIRDVDTAKLGGDIVSEIEERASKAGLAEGERATLGRVMASLNRNDLAKKLLSDHVVRAAAGRVGSAFADQPRVASRLWASLGESGFALGDFVEAERWLRRAIDMGSASASLEARELFATQQVLGRLLLLDGRYAEAEEVLSRALAGRKRLLGDRHEDTADTMASLGEAVARQGRLDDGIGLLRPALEAIRAAHGSESPRAVPAALTLAGTYMQAGQFNSAKDVLYSFPRLIERGPKADEPESRNFASYLAGLDLELAGDAAKGSSERERLAAEAERLCRALLALDLASLHSEHIAVLSTRSQIAYAMELQGKGVQAAGEYRAVLSSLRNAGADAAPVLMSTLEGLANLLLTDLSQPGEAVPLLEELVAIGRNPATASATTAEQLADWETALREARKQAGIPEPAPAAPESPASGPARP
ncbi:MAG: protein kinase [Phycisphaerales bacterium]|nr:protein kinase [Phycisphaerales bacterium]